MPATTMVRAIAVVGDTCSEPATREFVVSKRPAHAAVSAWLCSLCCACAGDSADYRRVAQEDGAAGGGAETDALSTPRSTDGMISPRSADNDADC